MTPNDNSYRSPCPAGIPAPGSPLRADLGLWNILGNPDLPRPQTKLQSVMCLDEFFPDQDDLKPGALAESRCSASRTLPTRRRHGSNGPCQRTLTRRWRSAAHAIRPQPQRSSSCSYTPISKLIDEADVGLEFPVHEYESTVDVPCNCTENETVKAWPCGGGGRPAASTHRDRGAGAPIA